MAQDVVPFSTSLITAADVNTTINGEPRIEDLRLAEALGFSLPRMIRKLIRRHLEALRQFGEVCAKWNKPTDRGGRPSQTYWLSKRQALYITAKSDTERAALVTVQMVEVFDAVTSGRAVTKPKRERRSRVPRPISKATLVSYASWLWGERVRVLEELYPDVPPGHRTGVAVNNPGYFFHHRHDERVMPPPSTRAEQVLKLVGVAPLRLA
ncbi:hypothetical protein ABEV34_21505 [Methylorubrum rhodesianum]|uniref:hypothetical protein n=1 Tax=Methylorubrum rhodesianum TaxID=29427 RepID=UPI003D270272